MKKKYIFLFLVLLFSSCKTSVIFNAKNELSPVIYCYDFNSYNLDKIIKKFKLNKYDFYIREDSVISENNCKYGLFYLTTHAYKKKDYIKDQGHPPYVSNIYSLEIPLILFKDTFFINETNINNFFRIERKETVDLNMKLLKSKLIEYFSDSTNTADFILEKYKKGIIINYLTPNYNM